MEKFRLSTERRNNLWFGCLLDNQARLVASAFGPVSKNVTQHLADYSKNKGGDAVRDENSLTHEMIELFEGKKASKPVVYNMEHVSKFQRQVYDVLGQIPYGKVTTYGLISRRLGSAPRAVGRAVASNPWPLFIPCQRVVNFNLTVGNYGICGSLGPEGTVTKRSLLQREGVDIIGDRIEQKSLWDPSRQNL